MIENLIDGRFQAVHAASIPLLNPSTGRRGRESDHFSQKRAASLGTAPRN
jgi:hypothetical protein